MEKIAAIVSIGNVVDREGGSVVTKVSSPQG